MNSPFTQRQDDGCVVIAEIAQAHDGSLGMAHAYIDAVAEAGADAVKFQTHIAAAESTRREPWRAKFSRQDDSRYDYWQRMEFSEAQWAGLKAHAAERDLLFISSPFSEAAVELLERIGVDAWKIASGEVGSGPLLDAMASSGLPTVLSTGMSDWAEIDAAVERLLALELPTSVLQCTSMYPTPPEKVGLGVLAELRARYGLPVGLSDHSGTIHAGLAAVALGASIVEVHVAFSRHVFSPDLPVSLTIPELRQLCDGARAIPPMLPATDKDALADELRSMRGLFTKSLVAARPLEAGQRLTRGDIALKKPGDGLGAEHLDALIGRVLSRPLEADERFTDADLADL
ncbi:MAG: N-acetylneuraminate synthase family protein [Acidobacteriota bacterium]